MDAEVHFLGFASLWVCQRRLCCRIGYSLVLSFLLHSSGLMAAHKSLPFGTRVRVVNLDNGRSAIVKIVDRGPFVRGRIIDVCPAAAVVLGFRQAGVAHVRIEIL